jgi:acetyltransferase-like isoleucine patch superfamily enzyme
MLSTLLKRFLVPRFVVSLYYYLKFRAKISPRAEVELSSNLRFGPDCTVSSFTKIKATHGPLVMGARCGLGTGCFLSAGEEGTIIGDNFVCGPNTVITSSNYIYDDLSAHLEDQGHTSRGIRIGDNVWIGSSSVILDGSELGDNTIVVANSLVNRRYPPNSILQGNPAKLIMKRTADE